MNRREFIFKTTGYAALLTGTCSFTAITESQYKTIAGERTSRFAVASDGHFGQPNTDFDAFHTEAIDWINAENESKKIDFVVFNGDLVHDDESLLPKVKQHFDRLKMPYHVSRGNHDRCGTNTWRQIWGKDTNHSFVLSGNAFIILDTSNAKGDYLCPDKEWLVEALEKHRLEKNLFVFMHITPVKWTSAGIDCPEVIALFALQKNLRGVFHGHDHDEDFVKEADGKYYFFDSHIGGNWGTSYRGYRIVEITETNDIITYQVNPQQRNFVNKTKIV